MTDLSVLGISALQHGDLEGARALFQVALDQRVASYGQNSVALINELANLGNALAELHDEAAARPLLEQVRDLDRFGGQLHQVFGGERAQCADQALDGDFGRVCRGSHRGHGRGRAGWFRGGSRCGGTTSGGGRSLRSR